MQTHFQQLVGRGPRVILGETVTVGTEHVASTLLCRVRRGEAILHGLPHFASVEAFELLGHRLIFPLLWIERGYELPDGVGNLLGNFAIIITKLVYDRVDQQVASLGSADLTAASVRGPGYDYQGLVVNGTLAL